MIAEVLVLLTCVGTVVSDSFCIPSSASSSTVNFSRSCSDGNVLFISSVHLKRTNSQTDCQGIGNCYIGDVSNVLKINYGIEKSFSYFVNLPSFPSECTGQYVNLYADTYCIGEAKTYSMSNAVQDSRVGGNFFMLARYNMYMSNAPTSFHKASITIPPYTTFAVRILEMYALSNPISSCTFKLIYERPTGTVEGSFCMSGSFSGDYRSFQTTQETEVSFSLVRNFPTTDIFVDLKVWIMVEIRDSAQRYLLPGSGVKLNIFPMTPSASSTTSSTTTTISTTTPTSTSTTTTTLPTSASTTTTTSSPISTSTSTSTTTTATPILTSSASSSSAITTSINSNFSSHIPLGGLSTEAKIGLGIGLSILCLFIFLCIVGLILLFCSRRRKTDSTKDVTSNDRSESGEENETSPEEIPDLPAIDPPGDFTDDKYKAVRKKSLKNKIELPTLMERFAQDPSNIYYPIDDPYSTVSKNGSVRDWNYKPPSDTIGTKNGYPSDTWEFSQRSPESGRGSTYWEQDSTFGPPMPPVHYQPDKSRFQKNTNSNRVMENNSRLKVKKAKHVSISSDPPSYIESQMDRPNNFVGGSNFMF